MLQVLLLALFEQIRNVEPIQVRRELVERAPAQVAPFGLGLDDLVVVNDTHKVLTRTRFPQFHEHIGSLFEFQKIKGEGKKAIFSYWPHQKISA